MKNEHNSTINSLKCPLTREEINELSGNFNGGVIVMTYGNNAWVSFIENWLCFAKKARLRTLVLAMNETICQRIEKFKTSGILCKSAAEMTSSLIANSTYGKSSWWGSPNYKLMMRHKMAGLYSVLQCRRPVLLSDADAIIARNPVPYLLNLTSNTHPSYDMVFAKDSTGWNKIDQLGFAGRLGRFYVCAGRFEMSIWNLSLLFTNVFQTEYVLIKLIGEAILMLFPYLHTFFPKCFQRL